MSHLCPVTQQDCKRGCVAYHTCELHKLAQTQPPSCPVIRHQAISKFPEEDQFWLPKEGLGILQHLLDETLNESQKRKRAAAFRNLTRVLVGLKLLPAGLKVTRIAYGCSPLGEQGLLISTVQPTRVVPNIQETPL